MAVKIGVLIKNVPDTNTKIQLKGDAIDEGDIKYVINPYDEFAIEEAVKTKEAWTKAGQTVEVVGVCLGPTTASKSLRDAFAVGVDRGVHILDNEKKAIDPRSVSQALAKVCQEENFNLIFAGKQAVDTDSHSVATMVAERLKMPHMAVISKCEFSGTESVQVERDIEGGIKEVYKIKLPALLTANKGLNKMRLASLPGIRAASKKEIKEVPLSDIKAGYKVSGWGLPPERGKVKMIEGEPPAQAAELVKRLHEEAKVV
ncbi:MAG: Electron transfer flavoprotein subunit beta [Bacteriovoracaceae bacterium]|nr:Electron transfer flavoprotein subunit beta [Bacteriovoracaceae bacterium]